MTSYRRLVLLVLAAALAAGGLRAQEFDLGIYNPDNDVVRPDAARWLYLGSVLYQAGFWSGGLILGFGAEGNKAVATELLVTPATFFGFLWQTRHRRITLGMTSAGFQGAIHGGLAGAAVGDLLFTWDQNGSERGVEPVALTAVAGSVTGHILGFNHAARERLNWGNSEMLGRAGLWSGAYAGLLASMIVPWDSSYFSEEGVPFRRKLTEVAALAGWGAGLWFWNRSGPRDFTTGDAISTYGATGLSVWSGVAVGSLLPDDLWESGQWGQKAGVLIPALVNAGGLWYVHRFHRDRDLTFGQSLLVTLGSGLGAGMGAGTTWLFTPEYESPSFEAVSLASAAGGWLGFHLVHALLETEEPQNETGRSDAGSPQPRVHLMLENAGAVLLARETGTACRAPLLVVEF